MKSIYHTCANFGTAQAKLIEPIFQSFCKERHITFPNIIVTSLALAKTPAVQFLTILNFFIATSFEPQVLRNSSGLFSKACLKIPQLLTVCVLVMSSTRFRVNPRSIVA